ncbi:hypothetical protein [Roseovarius dicentrarchi]|uniref:hypothetical protein n=1 Tax=Roseovarius dicentrarchi TaxID=2250573 RepID=UPI000DE8DCEF|nr:hypothetical protein [Roseovarius dicentrarchi]
MESGLPSEVQLGLDAARRAACLKSHRLRVEVDGKVYRILRAWPGGFAVDAADAPHLRGRVDLFDGARHISQCLIVAAAEEGGEWHFDYKRVTDASGNQPLDFERAPDRPAGLLEDFSS